MLISFIDILYGIAIGIGLGLFPENPIDDFSSSIIFFITLLISGHDWYEYHMNEENANQNQKIFYFIIQIFIVLMLNQMFVHATNPSFDTWLFYFASFMVLNTVWNIAIRFENHLWYALVDLLLTVIIVLFTSGAPLFKLLQHTQYPRMISGLIIFVLYFAMIYSVDFVVRIIQSAWSRITARK